MDFKVGDRVLATQGTVFTTPTEGVVMDVDPTNAPMFYGVDFRDIRNGAIYYCAGDELMLLTPLTKALYGL